MPSDKKSVAKQVYPQELSGSNTTSDFYQGVSITLIGELLNPAAPKFRPNNDFLKIRNVVRTYVLDGPYDEVEAPVSLSLTSGSQVTLDYTDRLSNTNSGLQSGYNVAPSHFMLDNDFGQIDLYQDGTPFLELDSFNNITGSLIIINSPDPDSIIVPYTIVNVTDEENIDGTIDPLDVRKYIDRTLEVPFHYHGTWGYIGTPDSYRRGVLIEQQLEDVQSRKSADGTLRGIEPFLDGEQKLQVVQGVASLETQQYIQPDNARVTPFVDTTDGIANSLLVSGSSDFLQTVISRMVSGSNLPGADYLRKDHVSLSRGFDYDNSEFGFDSVAFGGLLK